jgi:diadenosine tetraphosphate (Ap4A) HIT family hydrolase
MCALVSESDIPAGTICDRQDWESPFFDKPRVLENSVAFVIRDGFPVSEGHSLIVPKRVYSNYFESNLEELQGMQELLIATKQLLDEEYRPDGYNVGINCGEHAGQTVPHVHIHIMPRYRGDMDNPRGGVRGVIPSKQKY